MNDPWKTKPRSFKQMNRFERLSAAMYPDQSPHGKEAEAELRSEGWKTGQRLLSNHERGSCSPLGGSAVQPKRK